MLLNDVGKFEICVSFENGRLCEDVAIVIVHSICNLFVIMYIKK